MKSELPGRACYREFLAKLEASLGARGYAGRKEGPYVETRAALLVGWLGINTAKPRSGVIVNPVLGVGSRIATAVARRIYRRHYHEEFIRYVVPVYTYTLTLLQYEAGDEEKKLWRAIELVNDDECERKNELLLERISGRGLEYIARLTSHPRELATAWGLYTAFDFQSKFLCVPLLRALGFKPEANAMTEKILATINDDGEKTRLLAYLEDAEWKESLGQP